MNPLDFHELPTEEMQLRAAEFSAELRKRRTVREFSDRQLPYGVIEDCLRAASSAPSGANLQPWHFAVVRSPETKKRIREAAEKEEREFYESRAPDRWLELLAPLGTNADKPFLETAPVLIAIFQESQTKLRDGRETKTYYPKESVGIACGFLIAALHHAGLATLTHTPSPMKFLNTILDRPKTEKPFLLLVVGYPTEDCRVPSISRLPFEEVVSVHE